MIPLLSFPRQRQHEWMDDDAVDPKELRHALQFIRKVNARLGYTQAILHHLERFSTHWKPKQPITLLDIATGSADIPIAILKWAKARGHDLRITAVDRHALTARAAEEARAEAPEPEKLHIVQADVFDLPFDAKAFDYTLCAMFLHHLDEPQILEVLRVMDRLSRRGLIASDLLRVRPAAFWIDLLTIFSSPMIRHDARVSVRQALSPAEVRQLRLQAELHYTQYYRHRAFRFVLAGEKHSILRS